MALKYVQIETTTSCNQRCYFCPVSIKKRENVQLSPNRLKNIIAGLKQHSIESVVISGFNEPTYDKGLVQKVTTLRENGFNVRIFSNGSGLKPELTSHLLKLDVSSFTINLSTLDESQYLKTRGTEDLKRVIPNLDFLVAQQKVRNRKVDATLVVIGRLDRDHANNLRMIDDHYGEFITVMIIPVVEYAGKSPKVLENKPYQNQMQGCLWERHKEWMHFNAEGDAILCCHDYQSSYKLGSIDDASLNELFMGDNIQRWRGWIEGYQEAPNNFMCRKCHYAKRKNHAEYLQDYFCSNCILLEELGKNNSCSRCADVGCIIDQLL
ncbi:MAG: radical SAM protein [Calditrichales bacterium]|nr:radical SAM protein [Calditrichales bacterium]